MSLYLHDGWQAQSPVLLPYCWLAMSTQFGVDRALALLVQVPCMDAAVSRGRRHPFAA